MPQKTNRNWRRVAAVAAGTCCLAAALSIPGVFAEPVPEGDGVSVQDADEGVAAVNDLIEDAGAAGEGSASDEGTASDGSGSAESGDDANDAGSSDAGDAAGDAGSGATDNPTDGAGSDASGDSAGDAGAGSGDSSAASGNASGTADASQPDTGTSDAATSDPNASAQPTPGDPASTDANADPAADAADPQASTTLPTDGILTNRTTYTLSDNVTLTAQLVVPAGVTVTIDLAGHSITAPGLDSAISCAGNLTITDPSRSGSISGATTCVNVTDSGSLTLSSGSLTGSGTGVQVTSGSFTMNGGSLTAGTTAVNVAGGSFDLHDGSITGNGAGTGVNVAYGASFTMDGGSLSGFTNSAIVTAGTASMSDGTISDCSASNGGAVNITSGGSFELSGAAIISGCSAATSAGAVYAAGTFTMSGGTISGCSALNGGAVYIASGTASTMSAGTISACTATAGNGGGIYVGQDVTFTMTGGLIGDENATLSLASDVSSVDFNSNGNAASGYGGGIYGDHGSDITVTGKIIGNHAEKVEKIRGGGGIEVFEGKLTITKATINRNYAPSGGGVCAVSSRASITDSFVSGNVAWYQGDPGANIGNGGAVSANGSSMSAVNTTFDGNSARRHGGAVIASSNQITFTSCTFSNNQALVGNGGGLFFDTWVAGGKTITDCIFVSNSASGTGGGIHSRGTFDIEGGSITACTAGTDGGGISVVPLNTQVTPTFTLSNITIGGSAEGANNAGRNGGGVYISRGKGVVESGAVISFNTAQTGNGGGVYVGGERVTGQEYEASSFAMEGGSILSNYAQGSSAGNGGGVYVGGTGVVFTMSGGSIAKNAANGGAGGGVCLASAAWAEITGGSIEGNTALTHGGGIEVGGSPDHVTIGSLDHATVHPDNVGCPVIRDNTAVRNGGGLCVHGTGTTNVYCCDISGNTSTNDASSSALFQDAGIVNIGAGTPEVGGGAASNPGVRIAGNLRITSGKINIFDGVALSDGSAVTADTSGTVNDYRNKDCTVTYKIDDQGSQVSTVSAKRGEAFTLPAGEGMFSRSGWRVVGWKDAAGKVWNVGDSYMPSVSASSVEFVAMWELAVEPGYLCIMTQNNGAASAADADRKADCFVYRIEGKASASGEAVSLTIEVAPGQSATVELQAGTYTVTPISGWSWRYSGPGASAGVEVKSRQVQQLTMSYNLTTQTWKSVMTAKEAN